MSFFKIFAKRVDFFIVSYFPSIHVAPGGPSMSCAPRPHSNTI